MSNQPSMGDENTVGIRLKKAIKALGYRNVSQYIENNGLQKSTIYAIINKGRSPTTETLEPIAQTGINVNFLISGNGPILMPEAGSPEESHYQTNIPSKVSDGKANYDRIIEKKKINSFVEYLSSLEIEDLKSISTMIESLINIKERER